MASLLKISISHNTKINMTIQLVIRNQVTYMHCTITHIFRSCESIIWVWKVIYQYFPLAIFHAIQYYGTISCSWLHTYIATPYNYYYSVYTPSCRCEKFEDHSSVCFDYINDNVRVVNQSSYISAALANVIDIVNGSYCRERVMEFLCNYFFLGVKVTLRLFQFAGHHAMNIYWLEFVLIIYSMCYYIEYQQRAYGWVVT